MKNLMDRTFSEVAGAFRVASAETADACDACVSLRERLDIIARELGADSCEQYANIFVIKGPGIEIRVDQQRLMAWTGRQ